ncbi:EspA/EspE family type VII secretion system effector [Mycobacterium sp. NPDC003449]
MRSGSDAVEFGKSGFGDARIVSAAESPILAAGQRVIGGMGATTGVGEPEDGMRFGEGAQRFRAAGRTLIGAVPGDGWAGAGSSAYTDRTDELVGRTGAMVRADELVASVLSRQAEQIAATRDGLYAQSGWLADMSRMTGAAGLPAIGPAARARAELAMVARSVGESTDQLMTMQDNATANAAEVRDAVSLYAGISGAETPDDDSDPPLGRLAEDPAHEPEEPEEPASAPSGGDATENPAPAVESAAAQPQTAPAPPAATGAGAGSGADIAGALAGVMGSILGSLTGLLGGVAQTAGQAAQTATQAAQPVDPVGADRIDEATEVDEPAERDEGKDDEPADDGRDGTGEPADGEALAEGPRESGPDDDSAGEGDAGAAMTLPPDLQVASMRGAGPEPAPVLVEADLEQAQLRAPGAARLEPDTPGFVAVVAT